MSEICARLTSESIDHPHLEFVFDDSKEEAECLRRARKYTLDLWSSSSTTRLNAWAFVGASDGEDADMVSDVLLVLGYWFGLLEAESLRALNLYRLSVLVVVLFAWFGKLASIVANLLEISSLPVRREWAIVVKVLTDSCTSSEVVL